MGMWACGPSEQRCKKALTFSYNDQGFIFIFSGLTLIANQAFNLSGALGKVVSIGSIQDMWWYWIKRDGKMQKIAYCNSQSCVFDECTSTCQSRLRIDGATLELTEVREEDRGLQLQCQIFLKFQVYKMKISVVLPKGQFNLHHRSQVNNLKGGGLVVVVVVFWGAGGNGLYLRWKEIRVEKVYK